MRKRLLLAVAAYLAVCVSDAQAFEVYAGPNCEEPKHWAVSAGDFWLVDLPRPQDAPPAARVGLGFLVVFDRRELNEAPWRQYLGLGPGERHLFMRPVDTQAANPAMQVLYTSGVDVTADSFMLENLKPGLDEDGPMILGARLSTCPSFSGVRGMALHETVVTLERISLALREVDIGEGGVGVRPFGLEEIFEAADMTGEGRLSISEISRMMRVLWVVALAAAEQDDNKLYKQLGSVWRGSVPKARFLLAAYDQDGDGLSISEISRAGLSRDAADDIFSSMMEGSGWGWYALGQFLEGVPSE